MNAPAENFRNAATGALLVVFCFASPALAQEQAARGRLLYETYCGACHYEKVHERPRARSLVKSKAELRAQVMRWAPQTKYKFSRQEIEAVVDYLDRSHYKLEK